MQTMNISLPDPLKEYVEEQVRLGGYSSASEYVRELVRTDQKRKAKEELEKGLQSAMNEGEPAEATPEWWAKLQREVTERAQARKAAKEL